MKRPLYPLWQIREAERVPALVELHSAAACWLGVSPELVGLYTWHPPVLENALRMFVLTRMEHLGVQLGNQRRGHCPLRLGAGRLPDEP